MCSIQFDVLTVFYCTEMTVLCEVFCAVSLTVFDTSRLCRRHFVIVIVNGSIKCFVVVREFLSYSVVFLYSSALHLSHEAENSHWLYSC